MSVWCLCISGASGPPFSTGAFQREKKIRKRRRRNILKMENRIYKREKRKQSGCRQKSEKKYEKRGGK